MHMYAYPPIEFCYTSIQKKKKKRLLHALITETVWILKLDKLIQNFQGSFVLINF